MVWQSGKKKQNFYYGKNIKAKLKLVIQFDQFGFKTLQKKF